MKMKNENFSPGTYDVVCGRGKSTLNHSGNKRFRLLIHSLMNRYKSAPARYVRTLIIIDIVDGIRKSGGGFVKRLNGSWIELSDQQARKKVSHALRDAISAEKEASEREERKLLEKQEMEPLDPSANFECHANDDTPHLPMIEKKATSCQRSRQENSRIIDPLWMHNNEGEIQESDIYAPVSFEDAFITT
mmetsp:Transcript_1913/g.2656  ORF Transcript_1913/g.2656 Transcript_1913/m.2656 type:complete len:190 (+) Transcript_1913:139-708(+)